MKYLGDFQGTETLAVLFTTHAATGGLVAPLSAFEAADVRIYKNGSDVQRNSEAGYSMTSPFDGVTGLHCLTVDLSDNTAAGFFAAGHEYTIVLVPDSETVDGQTIVAVLATFSIQHRPATVRALLALPAAAPDAAGGLPVSDAGGLDLDGRLDVAVSSRLAPAVAGRTLAVSVAGVADAQVKDIDAGVVDVTAAPNLDAAVSSRNAVAPDNAGIAAAAASAAEAAVAAAAAALDADAVDDRLPLVPASQGDVGTVLVAAGEALTEARLARQLLGNDLYILDGSHEDVVGGVAGEKYLVVYDDDGETPLKVFLLKNKDGGTVALQGTGPVSRETVL